MALKLLCFCNRVHPWYVISRAVPAAGAILDSLGLEYGQEVNGEHKFKNSPKSRTL